MSLSYPLAISKAERAHDDNIWALNWTSREQLLTGSLDGKIKLWSINENNSLKCSASTDSEKCGVTSLCSTQDGSVSVASFQDSLIRFYQTSNMTKLNEFDAGVLQAWTISLSPNDSLLASGSQEGKIHIWSMYSNNEKLDTLKTPTSEFILDLKFNPNGSLIASSGIDGVISILDFSTKTPIYQVASHSLPVRSIAFSPDGKLLYSASDDRHVSIFDTLSGTVINTFSQSGISLSVDPSPDHRHFVVGCSDSSVTYWDLGMQRQIHSYSSHGDPVWNVKFDPRDSFGRRFASVGDDALLQLYD